jgi:hypothetical protein
MNLADISQIVIPFLSGASIWALAGKKHRLGFMFGLCGQPFWIYSLWSGELWGMFIVSLWFAGNHIRGLYNHRSE